MGLFIKTEKSKYVMYGKSDSTCTKKKVFGQNSY